MPYARMRPESERVVSESELDRRCLPAGYGILAPGAIRFFRTAVSRDLAGFCYLLLVRIRCPTSRSELRNVPVLEVGTPYNSRVYIGHMRCAHSRLSC